MIIYLISSELNNNTLYKIGITKNNVNKRLKQLKTGNPGTLTVIHTFESQYATKIEKHFHKSKATSNVGGPTNRRRYIQLHPPMQTNT